MKHNEFEKRIATEMAKLENKTFNDRFIRYELRMEKERKMREMEKLMSSGDKMTSEEMRDLNTEEQMKASEERIAKRDIILVEALVDDLLSEQHYKEGEVYEVINANANFYAKGRLMFVKRDFVELTEEQTRYFKKGKEQGMAYLAGMQSLRIPSEKPGPEVQAIWSYSKKLFEMLQNQIQEKIKNQEIISEEEWCLYNDFITDFKVIDIKPLVKKEELF